MEKIDYETTEDTEWDEPIVIDMTNAKIGAHYVSEAIIKYLYDRFGYPTYTNKVSELYNHKVLISVRNLEKAKFDVGALIMFVDDCFRLILSSPRWKILIEKCINKEEYK